MPGYNSEVILRLRETLPDAERVTRFEEPLARELALHKLGEVAGGKALRGLFGGGKGSEIRLRLKDLEDDTFGFLRSTILDMEPGEGAELLWTSDGDEMLPLTHEEPEDYDPALIDSIARSSLASYRTLFLDSYTWQPANPADFPHIDGSWYDKAAAAVAPLGFRESANLRLDPDGPVKVDTYARKLRATDGRACLDLFQIVTKTANKTTVSARSEFEDGGFLISTNTPQMWNDIEGFDIQWLPVGTSAEALARAHLALLERRLSENPALRVRAMQGMDDVIALENRAQARTAAARRAQGTPDEQEMMRMGGAPEMTRLVCAEMRRIAGEEGLAGGQPADEAPAAAIAVGDPASAHPLQAIRQYGDWMVLGVDLPGAPKAMPLHALIQFALEQGINQVESAGSPLNSFLIFETGRCLFMVNEKGGDPMEIALQALKDNGGGMQRCALVIDSRITLVGGKKTDAIMVMACERGKGEGQSWARAYRPKGFLRSFSASTESEKIADCKNLFDEAGA